MDELKPCPFCGGEAELNVTKGTFQIRSLGRNHYAYVRCKVCGASTHVRYTVENARWAWNRRTNDEQ